MSGGPTRFLWIFQLSPEGLREALEQRRLSVEGDTPELYDKLLRYELEAPDSSVTSAEDLATGRLRPPTPMRPDSPTPCTAEADRPRAGRGEGRGPRAPSSPRWEREEGNASAYPRSSTREISEVLRKWNVTFSGARGSDAEAFLMRVKESRALFPVSDENLLRCLPFFLTGTALYWFRTQGEKCRTWDEFEAAWRVRFTNPEFQVALRDEIWQRTQGDNEPVAEYLTCVQALCARLEPPWSLEERLNSAHRNMLPQLRVLIQRGQFRDFETLERLATGLEVIQDAAARRRAPPPPDRALFPELAYHPPKKGPRGPTVAAAALPMQGNADRKKPLSCGRRGAGGSDAGAENCWNCGKTGHFARECQEARRIHCFRCGKPEATLRNCPTCAGNAETSR